MRNYFPWRPLISLATQWDLFNKRRADGPFCHVGFVGHDSCGGGITCSKVTTNFLLFSENSLRSGLSLQAKILLTIKEKNRGGKHEKPKKTACFIPKHVFFSVVLHNLGKIRPNHWTLRGSDMPRMLCPARCRKV